MLEQPPEPLHHAALLRAALLETQASAPPRAEGVDAGAAVRITLGPDGLPTAIRVADGWQQRLPAELLGAAVEQAFAAASAERIRMWPVARSGGGPGQSGPAVPAAAGRRVGDIAGDIAGGITEDAIAALAAARTPVVGEAGPAGTGTAAAGRLVLTLSSAHGVRCVAEPAWLARQDAAGLDEALAVALRAARSDLDRPVRDRNRGWDAVLAAARAALAAARVG